MKLSEAILMGRHTIEKPRAVNVEACAIPMALNAVGISCCRDENDPGFPERPFYRALVDKWPWLIGKQTRCQWCDCTIGGQELSGTSIVFHPFDAHVMKGEITLEQMCDWISTIEPTVEIDPELAEQYREEERDAAKEGALIEASNLPDPQFESNGRY